MMLIFMYVCAAHEHGLNKIKELYPHVSVVFAEKNRKKHGSVPIAQLQYSAVTLKKVKTDSKENFSRATSYYNIF